MGACQNTVHSRLRIPDKAQSEIPWQEEGVDVALRRLRRGAHLPRAAPGSSHLRGPRRGRLGSPDMVSTQGRAETRSGWKRPRTGSLPRPGFRPESPPPAQGGALESCAAPALGPGLRIRASGDSEARCCILPGGGEYHAWSASLSGQPME